MLEFIKIFIAVFTILLIGRQVKTRIYMRITLWGMKRDWVMNGIKDRDPELYENLIELKQQLEEET